MEFIASPQALLKSVFSKLKEGGFFGVTMPDPNSRNDFLEIETFSDDQFARFCEAENYCVVDVLHFFGWESGHLAEFDGRTGQRHIGIDYSAFILQK